MRILKNKHFKWNLKFLIACAITILLSIICGIVLYKINNISVYIYNFADSYVYSIFNFSSGALFGAHLLTEVFYLYIGFAICYFTRFKYLALPILFIRSFFTVFYCVILICLFGTEGIAVALLVFLPCFIFSVSVFVFMCEQCKLLFKPIAYLAPAVFALIDSLMLILLVNIVFRAIVVIA